MCIYTYTLALSGWLSSGLSAERLLPGREPRLSAEAQAEVSGSAVPEKSARAHCPSMLCMRV